MVFAYNAIFLVFGSLIGSHFIIEIFIIITFYHCAKELSLFPLLH